MIKNILSEIFFPQDIKCIACDGELSESTSYGLCPKCKLDYNTKFCLRCGRRIGSHMANYCTSCMSAPCDFDIARAPVVFTGIARQLVYKLKYGGGRYVARYLAKFMYDCFIENALQADVVTCVPMYKTKKINRGYNQAEELAKEFSALSGIEYKELLVRIRKTENLARMNKSDRRKAIENSIDIMQKPDGLNVLLIDDVFTSGTTSGECARILKKNKARSVSVLTFATAIEKIDVY